MAKKQEVIEVAFRPAQGGVISEARTRTRRSGQGGGPGYDYDTEEVVHPSFEHAAKHLRHVMGHCWKDEEES
jgi:hypothetical protein